MADFCWDCTRDVMGVAPEKNDFFGLCQPGEALGDICEGCGPGVFDHEGRRLANDQDDD